MATSKNARMEFESGQNYFANTAMTDSGDHKIFTVSGAKIFSGRSGYEPVVRPNGLVTGINLLSASGTADTVNYASFTAYSKGAEHEVSAGSVTITRPTVDNKARITSITMTDAGAIAAVAGTEGTTATFSETRGAAGGPPEIPADSVEIGQVRVTASASGVISANEIFQVPGTHSERYDLPAFSVHNTGLGIAASTPAKQYAHVEFADEIPAIHDSGARKGVYISYYAPIFAQVQKAFNFVPAEQTHSLNSQQYYDGAAGSVSSTLSQCSFSVLMNDNITDALVALKNEVLTFRFYPDKNKLPYSITQGIMGMSRTFPADNQNQADITVSAENETADYSS